MTVHAHCDAGSARSRTAPVKQAKAEPHLALATTILAFSLAFVDGSVVNVGLPTIGKDLHASLKRARAKTLRNLAFAALPHRGTWWRT